jgi:hypothetical protein
MIMVIQMWHTSGVDGPSIFLSQRGPDFDRRYTPFLLSLLFFALLIVPPAPI